MKPLLAANHVKKALNARVSPLPLWQLIAIILALVSIGLLGKWWYGYSTDTAEKRLAYYQQVERDCHAQPYIGINVPPLAGADSYIGPRDPGYAQAKRKALTPHVPADIRCARYLPTGI